MKNLLFPCLLVISLMTATAAQLPSTTPSISGTTIHKEIKTPTIEFTEVAEEADEAFDFDTAQYLPIGFDAYVSFEEKYGLEYEVIIEEADEAFDFDTTTYLPVGFDLKASVLNSIVEITIVEEDDAFDFDTKQFLPIGFSATTKEVASTDIK